MSGTNHVSDYFDMRSPLSTLSRPKRLDDVAHQEEVVQTLKRTLQSGNLPHLLLYGPPGTGHNTQRQTAGKGGTQKRFV